MQHYTSASVSSAPPLFCPSSYSRSALHILPPPITTILFPMHLCSLGVFIYFVDVVCFLCSCVIHFVFKCACVLEIVVLFILIGFSLILIEC